MAMAGNLHAASKVIAHRGFWDTPGSAENSRTAVRKAIEHGFHGAEIDIWATTDNRLAVVHNSIVDGITIDKSTFGDLRDCRLRNGETIPSLEEILDIMDSVPASPMKLIIEIKTRRNSPESEERSLEAARLALEAVNARGMENRVEFIAFNYNVCKWLAAHSDIPVAYLAETEDAPSPSALKADGIDGIDYKASIMKQEWLDEARSLGMTSNVWTVNNDSDLESWNLRGVDFITTNNPLKAAEIYNRK